MGYHRISITASLYVMHFGKLVGVVGSALSMMQEKRSPQRKTLRLSTEGHPTKQKQNRNKTLSSVDDVRCTAIRNTSYLLQWNCSPSSASNNFAALISNYLIRIKYSNLIIASIDTLLTLLR